MLGVVELAFITIGASLGLISTMPNEPVASLGVRMRTAVDAYAVVRCFTRSAMGTFTNDKFWADGFSSYNTSLGFVLVIGNCLELGDQ